MFSCGVRCISALIFIFNFLFLISAIGIIAAGVMVQMQFEQYMAFLGNDFSSPSVMLIVVGVIAAIIAFFGCCGAVKKNYCMMMTYSALLGVILILELAAGISAYVLQDDLGTVVARNMIKSLAEFDETSRNDTLTKSWKSIQEDMACCGVTGFKDWAAQPAFANTTNLPDTCCTQYSPGCGTDALANLTNINIHGCLTKFVKVAESNIVVIGGVGIGIAFIQIVGIIFACCLAKAIKSEYEEVA